MKKQSNSKIFLSVIIPAYNEVENFDRGVLNEVATYLKKQKYSWEVILVNDGSLDQTLSRLEKFAKVYQGFRVLDIEHGGKVAAVSAGVKDAQGEIVIFTDFDQSVPISELERVLAKFESEEADLVIGTRDKITGWTFIQNLRSTIFNLLVQMIILPGIRDSQCGFKAFKNALAQKLFSELKVTYHTQKGGYMGAFDVELLHIATKSDYKIAQVSVSWHYFKSGRLSWSEPIKMLRDVIKVRLEDLSGGYQVGDSKKKLEIKSHILPVVLLLLLTIPAFYDTLSIGYFPMHDDLQAMRQLVMDKCFRDAQFPCRWSVDLGYGFGYPIFNFYPPLPYYIGQIIHWLGLSFLDTVKALVVLNFIVSGLLMYMLTKEFWGRWGGLLSALFFVYAPYHAVDIYVRAAMNEVWAMAFMPGVFWGIYKLITTGQKKYIVYTSLLTALLMLSHNPMLMIFVPSALVWTAFWLIQSKNFRIFPKLILAGVWALGLAAFFTLPVIFETKFAHVESLVSGYFNYLAHFANLNQLFLDRMWGYGDSRFGPIDEISFQVGHLHWILALLSLTAAYLNRKNKRISLLILVMFMMALGYTFMNHQKSSFIWSAFKPLEFLQFPWRFLTMSTFTSSFLAGSVILLVREVSLKWLRNSLFILLIVGVLVLYQPYFRWKDHWAWVDDTYKFSGELWRQQTVAGIFDYLPIWSPLPPPTPPKGDAEIVEGQGSIEKLFKNSIKQEYRVVSTENTFFQINTFYFPGWKYYVNGTEVDVQSTLDPEFGRPRIRLSPGEHLVVAKLENTPIRTIGNSLSLVSWITLLGFLIRNLKLKKRFYDNYANTSQN